MPTDQVDETKIVEPEPGYVAVMHKMLPTLLERVVLQPIAPDSEHCGSAFLDSDDIRKGYACRITVVILILITFQIQINMHLKDLESVIH